MGTEPAPHCCSGSPYEKRALWNAVFHFPDLSPPLSWHLTATQRHVIEKVRLPDIEPQPEISEPTVCQMKSADIWRKWQTYRETLALWEAWSQVKAHLKN